MSKKDEALKLAQEALEYISSHYMSLPKIGCMALAAVEEALAEQPAQPSKPLTDEQQIAEALRRHGLTLVKTATGYDVLKLEQITAHGIKGDA